MKRSAALLAGIVACIAIQAWGQASTITVTFATPSEGGVTVTPALVRVQVQSANEITSAVATAGTASANLSATTYCVGPGLNCFPVWAGALDLTSFPRGPVQITVTAKDGLGNSGSAVRSVIYDQLPSIVVTSPVPGTIARPQLAVVARCLDDNPAGCSTIKAFLSSSKPAPPVPNQRGPEIASGTTRLNTVTDLSSLDGATRYVIFEVTDSTGRTVIQEVGPIYVEASGALEEVAVVPGRIVDADAARVLYTNLASDKLSIRDRASGADTQLHSGPMVSGNAYIFRAFLTPAGAAFTVPLAVDPYNTVRSFESGAVQDVGAGAGLGGEGRYIAWIGTGSNLNRRDVVAGTTIQLPNTNAALSEEGFVASSGAIAFSTITLQAGDWYDVGLYRPDGTTTMLTSDPDNTAWNVFPKTDGAGVVYQKRLPNSSSSPARLFLARNGTQQELVASMTSPFASSREYEIANGWVGYQKPGPTGVWQVWRGDVAGSQTQLTFSNSFSIFEKLADDGSITFTRFGGPSADMYRRFLVGGSSTESIDMGTGLGVASFVENVMHVAIEGTLLRANAPALRASPGALTFASHEVGTAATGTFSFTNTGAAPVTVGSAIASGDFSVDSNTCTTVAPGASCAIGVNFAPSGPGMRSGTLTITGEGAQQARTLTGFGPAEKLPQAITFGPIPTLANGSAGSLTASSTSGLPVTIRAISGVCAVSRGIVHTSGGPTLSTLCRIEASQPGDATYAPAAPVVVDIQVGPIDFGLASLTVYMAGGGSGTVASSPANISCGPASCAGNFHANTNVTLTATPAAGSVFGGWQGVCSGTAPCTLSSGSGATVRAIFDSNTPRLHNLSTRGIVRIGNDVLIAGFIVGGTAYKTVVVRARGPSLSRMGVPGALADPVLQVFSGTTQIAVSDNWLDSPDRNGLMGLGLSPSTNANPDVTELAPESALLLTLAPGAYTAIVTGSGATQGIGIVEVFEVDEAGSAPLMNISTRGRVEPGDNVLIAGFIVEGSAPQTVVVRARGPSLTQAGLTGVLANPQLQLFAGQAQLASNDNWQDAANAGAIQSSGFAPLDPMESAILMTLQPGAYTAIVTGAGGTSGTAIVEVFKAN